MPRAHCLLLCLALSCSEAPSGADAGNQDDSGSVPPDGGLPDSGGGNQDSGPVVDGGNGTDAGRDGGPDGGSQPGCIGSVPTTYNANSDRTPRLPGAPPALGDAGYHFADPSYGTRMLRLTDANTGGPTVAYHVANEFWGNDWNSDSTLFYIQASTSGILYYQLDPATFTAKRVTDSTGKPLAVPIYGGGFSRSLPNILYGMKGLKMAKFDFSSQTETDLFDLTTAVPGATGYSLGLEEGSNGLLATSFGGPQQDKMPYVATWDPATGASHVIDTYHSTLDGSPIGATIDGGVHTIKIDSSGRYVSFAVSGGALTNWLWDTTAGTVTSVKSTGVIGSGDWIERAPGDSYAWELLSLGNPTGTPLDLVAPQLSPLDKLASSSASWENAVANGSTPMIVETMRQPADDGGWRAWDDELIAVRTDGVTVANDAGVQESTVWRFAHNYNSYSGTIYSDNFYYLFIPRVSQNGWFAIIDSNWNQTLGTDSSGNPRTDVFLVALPNSCGP